MDELMEILKELHPDVDFSVEEGLIDNGILDSFDIVSLAAELNDQMDVTVPAEELLPENFNSAAAIWELIQRLQEA